MSLPEPFSLDLSLEPALMSIPVPLQLAVMVATNSEPAGFACLSGALTPDGNSSVLSEYITERLRGNHRNLGTINTLEEQQQDFFSLSFLLLLISFVERM